MIYKPDVAVKSGIASYKREIQYATSSTNGGPAVNCKYVNYSTVQYGPVVPEVYYKYYIPRYSTSRMYRNGLDTVQYEQLILLRPFRTSNS